jgi:hypothetical protein
MTPATYTDQSDTAIGVDIRIRRRRFLLYPEGTAVTATPDALQDSADVTPTRPAEEDNAKPTQQQCSRSGYGRDGQHILIVTAGAVFRRVQTQDTHTPDRRPGRCCGLVDELLGEQGLV